MTAPDLTPDELLAAEYVLGLLEGEPLLDARGRMTGDAGFAARVRWWEDRLAPLLDEVGGSSPGPDLWHRIEANLQEINSGDNSPGAEVIALRRRLRNWRRATFTAIAASIAALVFALTPMQRAPVAPPQWSPVRGEAPLVASIPIADTPLRLAVTWLPERRELLVSAAGLTPDGVHDHELWLVTDGGPLHSLGVVEPGRAHRVALTPEVASAIHDGSRMLLTREPLGGKPRAAQAGPVVAEGKFTRT